MTPPPLLVFTDLDGTLLDHHDYSWSAAQPALTRLAALGVPVVLASSKTAAEIAPLRAEMGLSACPAIVENGAGLLPGHAAPDDDSTTYTRLRGALETLPAGLRRSFRGFGDMTDAEVAEVTGLPLPQATLARRRAFSEPGVTTGDADALVAALTDRGITARRGGRFLTLSFGGTKADRMEEIAALYGHPATVALGDAPNDVEMLEAATYGFVLANPSAPTLPPLTGETAGHVRRSEKAGPDGWNASLLGLLSELGL